MFNTNKLIIWQITLVNYKTNSENSASSDSSRVPRLSQIVGDFRRRRGK